MSSPKPFLDPNDPYARLAELERRIKALETTPRTQAIPLSFVTAGAGGGTTANVNNTTMTGAVMTAAYECLMFDVAYDAIYATFPWSTDAATTGEVDIQDRGSNGHPGNNSNPYSLPANSTGYVSVGWLHGKALGPARRDPIDGSGLFRPATRVRRVSGAGNVTIYPPTQVLLIPSFRVSASAAGVWVEV